MKEEQEELCISQEGEVLAVKLEANSLMVTPISEENNHSEAEQINEQQDEEGSQHVDSGLAEEEEPRTKKRRLTHRSHSNSDDHCLISEIHDEDKTDGLQLRDCKVEEVVAVQQLWNQMGNSCLDQEDEDAAQVKVEEEDLRTSQEEQLELKQETDAFMVTPAFQQNNRETKSHSDQPLFHNSPDGKTQDRRADGLLLHNCKVEEVVAVQQLWNQDGNSCLDQEDGDAAQVKVKEEAFCTSREEQLELKQESDTFMVTPAFQENNRETKTHSDQPLFHNSCDAKTQDQRAGSNVNPGSSKHEEPKPRKKEKSQVKNHHKSHTVDKIKLCDICGKRFSSPGSLLTHMEIHKAEKQYSCKTCGKKFTRKCTLEIHTRVHTGERPYSCETCGKKFTWSGHLTVHMRSHTGERPYCCETCGKKFTASCSLKAHLRSHTGERPYFCETCGRTFTILGYLKSHMRIHIGEKRYSCDTCGQCFNDSDLFKIHTRSHTGEMPYSCETCGKNFTALSTLKTHMRIHTGEKPYCCETCGQSFNYSNRLKSHIRSHTGEKPYSCETCGQCFYENSCLKVHMRCHTGEKPYSCETCGKSFTALYNLKKHMRIHTGEKPYSCETCGQKFIRNDHLNRHTKTHTGEKPYSCKACGQSFTHSHSLKTHMRIHIGEKPYSCD
ncbi:uncharacterized protein KZ484_025598 [Pholidichthys leucotaenia]